MWHSYYIQPAEFLQVGAYSHNMIINLNYIISYGATR
jgi:hypothetical protein